MIRIQFKGDTIKGAAGEDGHAGWINVDSFQLGVGRSINQAGRGTDRDPSNPSFAEATFSRKTDKASPDLFKQAVHGQSLGELTIHFLQTAAGDKTQVYLEYILGEPIISSYSISSGGERPTESFSVHFVKIHKKYTEYSGSKVGVAPEFNWDLIQSKTY